MGDVVVWRKRHKSMGGTFAFMMFPGYKHGGRWLYAVGFADGRVKYGIARNPRERIRSYWNVVGGALSWVHVFGRAPGRDVNTGKKHPAELIAIRNSESIGSRIGRSEYVSGLTKHQALECMRAAISEIRAAAEPEVKAA